MNGAVVTLHDEMAYASRCDATTLIIGKGGDQEEVARLIHDASRRRHQPFVAVPCTALTESLLEQAPSGTLFLDAVEAAPPRVQKLLSKFLGEASADVRVIAATSSDLFGAVAAGRFRDDLYYRLNVIQLRLV
jgi:DNA-binding NtrC family response regulator